MRPYRGRSPARGLYIVQNHQSRWRRHRRPVERGRDRFQRAARPRAAVEARAIYVELGVSPTERGIVQLPRDYASHERWRVEAAMQRAGVRLGAVLNQVARERAGGPTAAVEVGR